MAAHSERILYVEDDEDIREMMTSFLLGEGYEVASFRTAEEGLEGLEKDGCDLLLTDYVLPGEDGGWLIAEATSRQLLDRVPVIVVSAEHRPPGIGSHRLLRKPVPVDVLLEAIETALAARVRDEPAPPSKTPPLDLVLYVSTPSHESDTAKRNLARILRAIGAEGVNVVVHDIAMDGEAAMDAIEQDRIVVVPTLVRRSPLPKVWIAGDLSKRDYVASILGVSSDTDA